MFSSAYGLKCYDCTGTQDDCAKDKLEADKEKKLITSPAISDTCMRTWAKKDGNTVVTNSCVSKSVCDTSKKACDDNSEGDCAVGCCQTDECNASSSVSFSAFVIAVCSAVGLALLK